MTERHRRRALLGAVLLLALALRLYHVTDPPWDYHNWRQSITLMVARDFARHSLPLLHPQVAWVSHNRPADPSYFSAEFSVQSVIAALLYNLFGESDTIARMIVIAFSLLGIYFLYALLERRAGPRAAALGALLYALLPYSIFFGRVFMPEIPALALALGSLDALDRWTERRTWIRLLAASTLAALAVLQKLTVGFLAVPALYLFWTAYGWRLLARPEPYLFGAIAGLPSLAWYLHAAAMARASGFAIMQPFRFGRDLGLWLQPVFLRQMGRALAEVFSPLGLALAAAGLCWRTGWIFRWWILGAASVLLLTPNLLPQNFYYLSILMPGAAAAGGIALDWVASRSRIAVAVVLAIFAAGAIHSVLPLYEPDRAPRDLGLALRHLSDPADLIVTETGGSPVVLYFADRRGWMLGGVYDVGVIERLRKAGARYYADVFLADAVAERAFFTTLDGQYRRLTPDASPWRIYDLEKPGQPR